MTCVDLLRVRIPVAINPPLCAARIRARIVDVIRAAHDANQTPSLALVRSSTSKEIRCPSDDNNTYSPTA